MKLIFCPQCQDVKKLTNTHVVECECGASWGIYLDEINAEYGGRAIPIAIANGSLVAAIRNRPSSGTGSLFDAFVIPKECSSCVRVELSREEMVARRFNAERKSQEIPLNES